MDKKRWLGVDLHRDSFTCCIRLENGRNYLRRWKLAELAKFVGKLRASDEVARRSDGEHAVVLPSGSAAGGAGGGGRCQPVSSDCAFGQED